MGALTIGIPRVWVFLGKSTNELMMLLLKARYQTSIDWSCMYSCSFTKENSIQSTILTLSF